LVLDIAVEAGARYDNYTLNILRAENPNYSDIIPTEELIIQGIDPQNG
jgi:hypothetical protein